MKAETRLERNLLDRTAVFVTGVLLAICVGAIQSPTVSAQSLEKPIFLPYLGASPSRGIDFEVEYFGGPTWGSVLVGSSIYVGHGPVLVRVDRTGPGAGQPNIIHRFHSARTSLRVIGERLIVGGPGTVTLFAVDEPGKERVLWTLDEGDPLVSEVVSLLQGQGGFACRVVGDHVVACRTRDRLFTARIDDRGIRILSSIEVEDSHFLDLPSISWAGEERVIVSLGWDERTGTGAGLDIIDIRDPSAVSRSGSIVVNGVSHEPVLARGRWLFAGEHRDTRSGRVEAIAIYDLDAPEAPRRVADVESASIEDLLLVDDQLYALADDGSLQIVDVSDPTRPRTTALDPLCVGNTSGDWRALRLLGRVGKHLVSTCSDSRLVVLDVSNSAEPRRIAEWYDDSVSAVLRSGFQQAELIGDSIVMQGTWHLTVVDIGTPVKPAVEMMFRTQLPVGIAQSDDEQLWNPSGVVPADSEVADGILWRLDSRSRRLTAVDIRDRSNPRWLGEFKLPGPLDRADRLAVGHGRVYVRTPNHGISVFKIADLERGPGPYVEWRDRHGLPLVHGRHLILVKGQVIEVVDPTNLTSPQTVSRSRFRDKLLSCINGVAWATAP